MSMFVYEKRAARHCRCTATAKCTHCIHQLLSNKAVMQTIVDSFVPNIELVVFCFVYCLNFFFILSFVMFFLCVTTSSYNTLLKYLLGFSLSYATTAVECAL